MGELGDVVESFSWHQIDLSVVDLLASLSLLVLGNLVSVSYKDL